MNWLGFLGLAAVVLAAHAVAVVAIGPGAEGWLPDPACWLILAVICLGRAPEAVTAAWIVGCLRDGIAPDHLGLHSAALACSAFPAARLRALVDVRRGPERAMVAAVFAASYAVALGVGRRLLVGTDLADSLMALLVPLATTVALAPPAVAALQRWPTLARLVRRNRLLGAG